MATARRRLGSWNNAGSRGRVYLTDDAIEVDEADGWNIDRRRVFLDDIVLITLHRSRSWFGFWTMMCMALSILLIGAGVGPTLPGGTVAVIAIFAGISSPFLLIALLFLRPFAVVTVVGRRTRTRLTWWFRHGRAAASYHELCRLATARAQPDVEVAAVQAGS